MELKPGNRLPETHPTPHHHCNLTRIRSPWVCESLSEDLHLTPQCSLWSQLHRQHEAGGLVFPPTIRLSTCMTAHFSFNNTKLLMAQFVVTKYCTGKKSLTYSDLIWLLQNQNRTTCILYKPANYCILITAIFTPQCLLTAKSSNNVETDSL